MIVSGEMIARITELLDSATAQIASAISLDELEKLRVRSLGKNGEITSLLRGLKEVPADERPAVGDAVNRAKREVEEAIKERREALSSSTAAPGASAAIDVSLPGIRSLPGRIHPITATLELMKEILIGIGFSYDDYPVIESEYFNFDALNTPAWHPARDIQDTFYTEDGSVLRTHTSAFQARAMRHMKRPPIRAFTSGRCYRRDEIDASHFPAFHQLDAIAVDRGISFADLKWTLYELLQRLYGRDVVLRFRPSYFPFTTPSAEVDVRCMVCLGEGCSLCSRSGWIELLGCGMMRPEVIAAGELDPSIYQGFAFGIGVDRITMRRYQIDDIRLLVSNEEPFLRQF
jgi:phenylalanyl-tRNA synthetase alpha chain